MSWRNRMVEVQPDIEPQQDDILGQLIGQYNGQAISYHGTYQNHPFAVVAYYVEKLTGAQSPDIHSTQFIDTLHPYFNHQPYVPDMAYPRGTILMWPNTGAAIVIDHDGSETAQVFDQSPDDNGNVTCHITQKYPFQSGDLSCSYVLIPTTQKPATLTESKDASLYTVLQNESWYSIARKFGFSESELMEHNDMAYADLKPGIRIRLPIPINKKMEEEITYKAYDTPLTYHINKAGGAYKYSFGYAEQWKDITYGSGLYPQGKEVHIVAEAYVPIEGDTAKYLMDSVAFGGYLETGRVRYTIGFNHSHLSEGIAPVAIANPEPDLPPTITDQIDTTLAVIEPELQKKIDELPEYEEPFINPNAYKQTWIAFKDGTELFIVKENFTCYDLDEKRPERHVLAGTKIVLDGTVLKGSIEYGIRSKDKEQSWWYGFPMSNLKIPDEELFTEPVALADRIALKSSRIEPWEKYIVTPLARGAAHYTRLNHTVNKVTKKLKEKR